MRKYNLVAKVRQANTYRKMAQATQEHKTWANPLKRQFDQGEPEKVLLTDITYLKYNHVSFRFKRETSISARRYAISSSILKISRPSSSYSSWFLNLALIFRPPSLNLWSITERLVLFFAMENPHPSTRLSPS